MTAPAFRGRDEMPGHPCWSLWTPGPRYPRSQPVRDHAAGARNSKERGK